MSPERRSIFADHKHSSNSNYEFDLNYGLKLQLQHEFFDFNFELPNQYIDCVPIVLDFHRR